MRGGDHSYPGVQLAAWNATIENLNQICFLETYVKLLATCNFYSTSGMTAISYHIYCVIIPRQYK